MESFKSFSNLCEENLELSEICISLVQDFIDEEYDLIIDESESEEINSEPLNIVLEYFVNNQNDSELYENLITSLMNESISSALASAIHGKKLKTTRKAVSAREKELVELGKKQRGDSKIYRNIPTPTGTDIEPAYKEKERVHARTNYGSGIIGKLKKYKGSKDVAKSKDTYEKAQQEMRLARRNVGIAKYQRTRAETKHAFLQDKIKKSLKPKKVIGAALKYGIAKPIKYALRTAGRLLTMKAGQNPARVFYGK